MTPADDVSYTIGRIHPAVARYLKRQRQQIRKKFFEVLDKLQHGPFPAHDPAHIAHLKGAYHCSYRYILKGGKHGLRIKYDVDAETRQIDIYDLGPRGGAY